jgi:serine/threonine protein kinase
MEFLEGETVADRLLRGPLSGEELIQCALQVAGALEHAHRQGVIHRDLKPSNIMLTESGAKLLDFGIATLQDLTIAGGSDAPARATTISANFGTVAYMSPEQVNGEPIDARSDLFSFGAVLYEMAVGRRPFPRRRCRERARRDPRDHVRASGGSGSLRRSPAGAHHHAVVGAPDAGALSNRRPKCGVTCSGRSKHRG